MSEKLIDKAMSAPTCFRVLVDALQIRLEREFPQLLLCSHWSHFRETAVVAGCVSLALRLHFELAESERTPIELAMRESLQRGFPNSEHLYVDSYRFVTESLLDVPRGERGKLMFLLIAMWAIRLIAEGSELERQDEIVAEFGMLLQNESAGYWKTAAFA